MQQVMSQAELDALSTAEATAWWEAGKSRQRGIITACALAYRDQVVVEGPNGGAHEQELLFAALTDLEAVDQAARDYLGRRKQLRREAHMAVSHVNTTRNHAEGEQAHRIAVKRALAVGKVTDAVRREYRGRPEELRAALFGAAHQNPTPLPELVQESREEQLVNDQLRSRGGIIHIETGNIEYRLPPDYSLTVSIPAGARKEPRK